MVVSLQNGSMPFASEELTFGKWRRDVADLRALFEAMGLVLGRRVAGEACGR